MTSVMSDFQSWLTEQNANPGAEEFGTYFQQYLQTGRANAIVNKWANEIFGNIDFNISSDTLQAMAKDWQKVILHMQRKRLCRSEQRWQRIL